MSLGSMLDVVFMLQVNRNERGLTPPPPPPPAEDGVPLAADVPPPLPTPPPGVVDEGVDGIAAPDRVGCCCCCCCGGCSVELSSRASPVTGFFNLFEILEKIDPRWFPSGPQSALWAPFSGGDRAPKEEVMPVPAADPVCGRCLGKGRRGAVEKCWSLG